MLTQNVHSGVGCFIDQARAGLHAIDRTFCLALPLESARRPLAPGTSLRAIRQGAFCSLTERGEIIPLNEHAPVAGLFHKMVDDRGTILAYVHVRGAFSARISGLTEMSKIGAAIHVTEAHELNLEGRGVVVGSLLAIESGQNGLGIIGFHRPDDERPITLSRNRTGGLVQTKPKDKA